MRPKYNHANSHINYPRKKERDVKKMKKTACKEHNLPYLAFHSDAERRHKRGERQVWCSLCQRWTWPEHVSDDHRPHTMTKQQFDRAVRDSEKKYAHTKGLTDGK